MSDSVRSRIAVIGAGPAGIAAGRELLAQGFDDFTIFDKQDAPGGTWHSHSYPGLACDLWAHSYTFTARPNPDWSANFVGRDEIEAYLQQCAREFGLDDYFRFNTNIVRAVFTPAKTWCLTTASGENHEFDVVINCMGGQHTPVYPEVEGMDSFRGEQWHSTFWNHEVDLSGKRVVVVGSAAAAVQVVPRVARQAAHLTVLQRTPNWIMPRNWQPYSPRLRGLFRRFPAFLRAWRWGQGLMMGEVVNGVTLGHKRMAQFEQRVHDFIATAIDDPALRAAVTPDTRYGCKRGLMSDDFYPALNRDNVELVAEGLQALRPTGIVTSGGREIDADVVIYCTGYRVMDFDRIEVVGLDGRELAAEMAREPVAFKGIAAPGFPNYFFSAGPNGLAINASYFANVETNIASIVKLLRQRAQRGLQAIAVREEATRDYNATLAPRFATFSWGAGDCHSYYRTQSGHAPFLFPGSFREYAKLHERCDIADFRAV